MTLLASVVFSPTVFEVVQGDLLRQPLDAIVNAANGQLAARKAPLSKVLLCLRDEPIIKAVMKELKV